MRLGIYGGTFDPIHNGHIAVARAVAVAHRLDRVLIVPAAKPPHKRGTVASESDRLEMVRLACQSESLLEASSIEIDRGGISYTFETLERLRQANPGCDLFFIIGADSVPELPGWRQLARIMELARIVAVNRPGFSLELDRDAFQVPEAAIDRMEADRVEMEPHDVASREIRLAIREGRRDLALPPAVLEFIEGRKLYGS